MWRASNAAESTLACHREYVHQGKWIYQLIVVCHSFEYPYLFLDVISLKYLPKYSTFLSLKFSAFYAFHLFLAKMCYDHATAFTTNFFEWLIYGCNAQQRKRALENSN